MKIIIREKLTDKMFSGARAVYDACTACEAISISGISEDDPGDIYVLTYINRKIVGYMELYLIDDHLDVRAFVLPSYRQRGIFSAMLKRLETTYENPIHLISDDISEGAKALVNSKRFKCLATEYLMIMDISVMANTPVALKHSRGGMDFFNTLQDIFYPEFTPEETKAIYYSEHSEDSKPYLLMHEKEIIGTVILNINGDCAYISSYGILFQKRTDGLGIRGLMATLNAALAARCKRAMVQVSANNIPAMGLYKKAGFRIFSKLSVYSK